jgi:hypothetical protein
MSGVLADPRGPVKRGAGRRRTNRILPCEKCAMPFVARKGEANRFCSAACYNKRHTDDTVKAARRLWAKGLSAGQIATALSKLTGMVVTKNAVIGLAHRRGFPPRPSPLVARVKQEPAA